MSPHSCTKADKNYYTVALVISQKFRENPSRTLKVSDLWEFPINVLTKIQIQREFALAYPEWFYYDLEGLHMREEAIRAGNPFLSDPQELRAILKDITQENNEP